MIYRILDANLNRLKEGIRVIEDIARYILNNENISKELKNLRHNSRINKNLLINRDVKNDVLKQTILSELKRDSLKDIVIANFKRAQESARVLEELLKLDSKIVNNENSNDLVKFKNIRYELYDIEIRYFEALEQFSNNYDT